MIPKLVLVIVLALPLWACQSVEDYTETSELDGVWRGVLSGESSHKSLQAHALDGLVLTVDLDDGLAHSAELNMLHGELNGEFVERGSAGERSRDYAVLGVARAYDRIEAELLSNKTSKALSLFYDAAQSYDGASLYDVEGLYTYYGSDLQISLSIDGEGYVEGYDDAGCGYFGYVDIPDHSRNIYAVSLDVSGCALSGDYGFGIGSLRRGAYGADELLLPIWFGGQDRVEAWVLQRD